MGKGAIITRKKHISAVVDPVILREVERERAQRRDEDGSVQSKSAVVEEALELWLQWVRYQDEGRLANLTDRIEATQEMVVDQGESVAQVVREETERVRRMVYQAHLKSEMAIQMFRAASSKAEAVEREEIRGRAAKIIDSERRGHGR
jgi:hypothetical protein